MHWPVLKEQKPSVAGVPYEQLLTGWVARVVADQEVNVGGRQVGQAVRGNGNPLVMVNVLAHDLRLCLAHGRHRRNGTNPGWREQLAQLFEGYPGLRLLTMDALYAERDLCQAIVSYGRDYLVRIKGNQPEVLAALADGFAVEELGEPEAETLGKKRV